jgi:hypothetical protein
VARPKKQATPPTLYPGKENTQLLVPVGQAEKVEESVPVALTQPTEPQGPGGIHYPGYTDGDAVLYRGEVWYADGFMGANFVRLRQRPRRPTEGPGHVPEEVIQAVPVGATAPLPEDRKPTKPYQKVKTEKQVEAKARARAGQTSVGDEVAKLLDGKTYEDMCAIVAKQKGVKAADLVAKYQHLDKGRRRMTLGNVLRNLLKAA